MKETELQKAWENFILTVADELRIIKFFRLDIKENWINYNTKILQ